MANPNIHPDVPQGKPKPGDGKVKLLIEKVTRADGTPKSCVTRIPSIQAVNVRNVKQLSIQSLPGNLEPIEVLVPASATKLFSTHELKKKEGDPQEHLSVKLVPGQTIVFELNGTTGQFGYETVPGHCDPAHHQDFHIEEC